MKKSILLSALYLASLPVIAQSWSIAWKDEFKRNGLPDSSYWSFSADNRQALPFSSGNLLNTRVSDDHLFLQIHNDIKQDTSFTTAKMHTKNKISFSAGRLELKAKVPKDSRVLTTIGLISTHEDSASMADYGEIEFSNQVDKARGILSANVYNGGANQQLGNEQPHYVEMPYLNYHIYAFEWDEQSITIWFDDQVYFQHTREGEDWPFMTPMYLFINLKIAKEALPTQRIDKNFYQQLVIDYVRYFRKHEKDLSVQK